MLISSTELQRLVAETQGSVATLDRGHPAYPPMRGVLLEPVADGLRMVATNGRRLAWAQARAVVDAKPRRAVAVEARALRWWVAGLLYGGVTLDWSSEHHEVATRANGVVGALPIISGAFPNYGVVDRPGPCLGTVRRDRLLAAARTAAALLEGANGHGTTLTILADRVKLEVVAPWRRTESVTLTVPTFEGSGATVRVGCDVRDLVDLLPHGADVVRLQHNADSGCLFLCGRDDWRGVLASMKVDR